MRVQPAFLVCLSFVLLVAYLPANAQQEKEAAFKPPLGSGGAPGCSVKPGTRKLVGDMIEGNRYRAQVVGDSIRKQDQSCEETASLEIFGLLRRTIALPEPSRHSFSIVDFAPDGSSLLLASEKAYDYPNELLRDVSIAKVAISEGTVEWKNVWDIFGWGECDAAVEPQGFADDGAIVLRVRPSFMSVKRRKDCVRDVGLYRTDLRSAPARLPDSTDVKRYGKFLRAASQTCRTDPDIVGDCFTFRGRLAMYNGTPTFRIWRAGTTRILGTRDEPLPGELEKNLDWDTEAWGNYTVCPYTKSKSGFMQFVCVDSADQVTYKARK